MQKSSTALPTRSRTSEGRRRCPRVKMQTSGHMSAFVGAPLGVRGGGRCRRTVALHFQRSAPRCGFRFCSRGRRGSVRAEPTLSQSATEPSDTPFPEGESGVDTERRSGEDPSSKIATESADAVEGGAPSAANGERTAPKSERRERARKRLSRRLAELSVGDRCDGVVRKLRTFGAYIDIGAERDGLLHVRDMSVEFVSDPATMFSVGDRVPDLIVKYADAENCRLALSLLQREIIDARTPVRGLSPGFETRAGRVLRITNFGAFLDIGAEVDGFLHVTALWGHNPRATLINELRYGMQLHVRVTDVDEPTQHIALELVSLPVRTGRPALPGEGRQWGARDGAKVPMEVVLARPGENFDVGAWAAAPQDGDDAPHGEREAEDSDDDGELTNE